MNDFLTIIGVIAFFIYLLITFVSSYPIISVLIMIVFLGSLIWNIYDKKRKEAEELQRLSDLDSIISEYQTNPIKFETFAAKIFSLNGYKNVQVTRGTNDGGKDIIMYKDGCKCIVEVKLYSRTNKIGREKIQKLHSAKIDEKADFAILLTTSDFTKTAKEYAKKHSIDLVSGTDFVKMLPAHKQNNLAK